MRIILACLLFALQVSPTLANSCSQLLIDQTTIKQPLQKNICFYRQESPDLTLETVLKLPESSWQQNHQKVVNLGYTKETVWFRIQLNNQEDIPLERLIEIAYPVLDYIDLYIFNSQQPNIQKAVKFSLGDKSPFTQRPIQHRHFLVPLRFNSNEDITVYIKLKTTSSMQLPLTLWEESHFLGTDQTSVIGLGLYIGIMLVMVVYNLFLYLSIGDKSYLYYVIYVSSMGLFTISLYGIGFQYLWPNSLWWNDQSIVIFLSLTIVFGSQFTRKILTLKQSNPRLDQGFLFFIGVGTITTALSMWLNYAIMIQLVIITAVAICVLGVYTGMLRWKSGSSTARHYTLAWAVNLSGGIILAASKYDVLPSNIFTDNATLIGSAIEVTWLSLILADRINSEKRKRFAAQEHSLKIEQKSNEMLELRVQERTVELKHVNSNLERANNQLKHFSITDGLTGAPNRHHFDEILHLELQRCIRYSRAIALLLIDIDHFKEFNNTHGHIMGDLCLLKVSQTIQAQVTRARDTMARYGGEKFGVILVESPEKDVKNIAEKIRSYVDSLSIETEENTMQITLTIGYIVLTPSQDFSAQNLIEKADQALYYAKEHGRNGIQDFNALPEKNSSITTAGKV